MGRTDARELAARCDRLLTQAQELDHLRRQTRDGVRASVTDPLTGLYNRRHLTETLRRQLEQAHREERPLSILSIDVDHFKRFNDTHGHDAGDMVLRAVGSVLEQFCDGDETACRMGGEEFMLLLPDLSLQTAALRAEALRSAPMIDAQTRARIIAFDGQIERGNRLGQFVDQHALAGP